jgi:hypothetical protein
MDNFDTLTTRAAIFFSKILCNYFGSYKRGINFYEEYAKTARKAGKNNMTQFIAVVYSLVIVICAGAFLFFHLQIRNLDEETRLIEPRINREEEERLNGELSDAVTVLARYAELHRLYLLDGEAYESMHFLTHNELAQLYNTANLYGVRILSLAYNQEDGAAALDCFADFYSVPADYIRAIRQNRELNITDIDYAGYWGEREGFRFGATCRFE